MMEFLNGTVLENLSFNKSDPGFVHLNIYSSPVERRPSSVEIECSGVLAPASAPFNVHTPSTSPSIEGAIGNSGKMRYASSPKFSSPATPVLFRPK